MKEKASKKKPKAKLKANVKVDTKIDTKIDAKAEVARAKTGTIDHKTWIMVGFAIIALVFVIIAIVKFTKNEKYDSAYFHDDEGKIVLTMDKEAAALDDSKYEPNITHIVYYYRDGVVDNVKAFYEYATEKEAEKAYPNLGLGDFADSKYRSGRFVIFQVKKSNYENLTVESLKADIENLKGINALILDYEDGYINRYATLEF